MEKLTPEMTAMEQLLFLNQELFKMIEDVYKRQQDAF